MKRDAQMKVALAKPPWEMKTQEEHSCKYIQCVYWAVIVGTKDISYNFISNVFNHTSQNGKGHSLHQSSINCCMSRK